MLNDGKRLTDEILPTTLAKADDLVSSRPLTYADMRPEAGESLTPNHFVKCVDLYGGFARPLQAIADVGRSGVGPLDSGLLAGNQPSYEVACKTQPIRPGNLVYIAEEGVRKC